MSLSAKNFNLGKANWFQIFKYTVYLLILLNVIQFFREDFLAAEHTFRNGISWSQISDAYATTIDSAAWLILLLIFELETYVIDDEKLVGKTRWSLNIIGGICFIFIVQAFMGYYDKYSVINAFDQVPFDNACGAVDMAQSYVIGFDEYLKLTAANCASVVGSGWFLHEGNSILASADMLSHMKSMALTDVVNAGTWIIIVIVLQIDVLLQMHGTLTEKLYRVNIYIKVALYFVLFAAAVFWGYLSALLDFWDALLWIIAFFFIELNLFQWNEETRKGASSQEGKTI